MMSSIPASSCRCVLNRNSKFISSPGRSSCGRLIFAAVSLGICGCVAASGAHPPTCQTAFESVRCFSIIQPRRFSVAHRGVADRQKFPLPENTPQAATRSFELEVGIVELDLRLTADGRLLLFHDKKFDERYWRFPERLAGRPIGELTADEIAFASRRGCCKVGGTPVSFFESLNAPDHDGLFLFDIKGDFSAVFPKLIDEAERIKISDRVIVKADDAGQAAAIRKLQPQFGMLARVGSRFALESALGFAPELVQLDFEQLEPDAIEQIHRSGGAVLVKTLEYDWPKKWRAALDGGADAVLTDKAAELNQSIDRLPQ